MQWVVEVEQVLFQKNAVLDPKAKEQVIETY